MKTRLYIVLIGLLTLCSSVRAQRYQMDVTLADGSVVSYLMAKVQDVEYDNGRTIINVRGKDTFKQVIYNNTDINSISWSEYKGTITPTGDNTYQLDENRRTVVTPNYKVAFDITVLDGEKTLTVKRKDSTTPLFEEGDGVVRMVSYDFDLEGQHELDGVVEIRIPMYVGYGRIPMAAYMNETTSKWEPVNFRYDESTREIVIKTNHLTEYGAFSVEEGKTRKARLEYNWLPHIPYENNRALVEKLINFTYSDNPDAAAVEAWGSEYGDCTQVGIDFGFKGIQSLGFGSTLLEEFADVLGHVGTAVSVYQIMRSDFQGNDAQLAGQSMKLCLGQTLNWATYYCGNAILTGAMACVAILDYSITQFAQKAWSGRKDIYRKAYELYYEKGKPGYRTAKDWFNVIYPIMKRKDLTTQQIHDMVDKLVIDHCWKFWNLDAGTMAEYINDAHDNFGFTYGGGLTEVIRAELSNEQRGELYNGYLPSVFLAVKNHIEQDLWEEADKQMKEYTKQVNKVCMLTFRDTGRKGDKSEYADCIVRFKDIPKEVKDPELWQVRLREDGTGSFQFRVYAMHDAGLKPVLEVVNTENDVVLEIELHDLRAGYTRDTGENFIDLNDYDISGGDFEDKYEITFEPSFKHIRFKSRSWFAGDENWTGNWGWGDEDSEWQQGHGIYFEDWTDGIIDVMKAHKSVTPNTTGDISVNSMGMEMTGTFDSESRTGNGTWKLDWTFMKNVLSEQQVKLIFGTEQGMRQYTEDEVVAGHQGYNLLMDGTMQNHVEGTFTVQLVDGEYVYDFIGRGTYTLNAMAFDEVDNPTYIYDGSFGSSSMIPLASGVERNKVFTTNVTVDGKIKVTYQFKVRK